MRTLLAVSRIIDRVNDWVGRAVAWVILFVVIVSAFNAIFRKAFDLSSNAWLELQWYMFGAVFLLAAGFTLLNNEHVRVDILASRLPERVQAWLEVIGVLVFVLPVCILMLWLGWSMVVESYVTQEMSSNSGGLIRWPVKLLIPMGFLLLSAAALSHLIKSVGFLAGLCPNPTRSRSGKSAEEQLADDIARTAGQSQLAGKGEH